MKILVIDNYDSFVYNLVHMIKNNFKKANVDVFRNDKIEINQIKKFDKILLSPGPGIPSEANIMMPLIKEFASKKSILGVCLGHQAIAESFGAELINTKEVFHGVETEIEIINQNDPLFFNVPKTIKVARYHSWIVSRDSIPEELAITAESKSGVVMAISHRSMDIKGVQFHPESILTKYGEQIISNWLNQ